MFKRLLAASAIFTVLVCAGQAAQQRELTVFAASSLTNVLDEIGKAYTAETKTPVRFSYAASSALARQIESGAPADVFFSADQEWMNYLQTRNLIAPATRSNVVSNMLVLVAPADSTLRLKIAPGFAVAAALGENGRIATGDPASVPVGRYAKAALQQLGVWASVESRIVPADNVRTALNFVSRGEVPLGIVYATDAKVEPKVRVVDTFPESSHEPITYPVAATATAGADAAAFLSFLQGATARAIFMKAGFGNPVTTADACSNFKWDLTREVALFRGTPSPLIAGKTAADAPAVVTDRLYELALQPQSSVTYATPPSKKMLADGAFGGEVRLRVAAAGTYRVAIDSGFWLDVVQQARPLNSIDFGGSSDCAGPRKVVIYELPANTDLVLQISAASKAQAHITITQVPAPKP